MHNTTITKSFFHKYQLGETVFYRGRGRQERIQETQIIGIELASDKYSGDYVLYRCLDDKCFYEFEISLLKEALINNEVAAIDENIKADENAIDGFEEAIRNCELRIEDLKQKKQDLLDQLP